MRLGSREHGQRIWKTALFIMFLAVIASFTAVPTRLAAEGQDQCPPVIMFLNMIEHHRAAGHDVSAAEKLNRESIEAFQRGDRVHSKDLLEKAIAELDKLGPRPDPLCTPPKDLKQPVRQERGGQRPSEFKIPKKLREQVRNGQADEPPPAGASSYNDSPFGIYGPYEIFFDDPVAADEQEINSYLLDMGATWVQEIPLWLSKLPTGIRLYSRVGNEGGIRPSARPDYDRYAKILRERIAKLKHRVKVYEVGTEPDGIPPPTGWKGHETQYAKLLKITHDVVKRECPECMVVFGGLTGVGTGANSSSTPAVFLEKVLAAGAAGNFDAFEFKQHMQNADEYTEIGSRMKLYGKIMAKYGLDIKSMPVFIEAATHDGHARFPAGKSLTFLNSRLQAQSEHRQASSLVKMYVYSLAQGVDKIFWDLVVEHHKFGGSEDNPFDLYGVVHNKYNADGKKGKKLSFYSYKKMVQVLGASDFSSLHTIKDERGLHLYRVMVKGRPVWIAWSDSGKKEVLIEGLDSPEVSVVASVPSAASGAAVGPYDSAFEVRHMRVGPDGRLTVTADDAPLYVMVR